jgi:FkbM family methyltransferase
MIATKIARWLFPYGSVRPILQGVCRGLRYEVGPGIGATYCLGGKGYHHEFYQRIIRPDMHVWDIGANVGQSLLALGRLVGPKGSVNAFEPVHELAQLASRQARLNDMDHVQVHCAAVGGADGTLEFEFSANASTQGKLCCVEQGYHVNGSMRRMVKAVSLDSFVEAHQLPKPDFIKVDVEGAGAAVFEGARRILADDQPIVFIELHGPEEQQAVKSLGQYGYQFSTLSGETVKDPTSAWHNPILCQVR